MTGPGKMQQLVVGIEPVEPRKRWCEKTGWDSARNHGWEMGYAPILENHRGKQSSSCTLVLNHHLCGRRLLEMEYRRRAVASWGSRRHIHGAVLAL